MTIGVPSVTCLHRVRRIHKVRVRRLRPPNTQSQNATYLHSVTGDAPEELYRPAATLLESSCRVDVKLYSASK